MKKFLVLAMSLIVFSSVHSNLVFADDMQLERSVEEVLGTPYKWGGTTINGFDCSGFIRYVYDQYDVKLPRTSKSQANTGNEVEKEDLQVGDLVFFNTDGKGISHAGIYLGNGDFAHSSSNRGVSISNLEDKYYKNRYVTARRVMGKGAYLEITDKSHEKE